MSSLWNWLNSDASPVWPGVNLDTHLGEAVNVIDQGAYVNAIRTDPSPSQPSTNQRAVDRQAVAYPARLTWKDQRGATRFASVVARNVSDYGVYVECQSVVSIPLYRLVQFQLERDVRDSDCLPDTFRQGRMLSAVYRVSAPTRTGKPQGLALRLMVDPRRRVANVEAARATA
jgi:hypothetical protein